MRRGLPVVLLAVLCKWESPPTPVRAPRKKDDRQPSTHTALVHMAANHAPSQVGAPRGGGRECGQAERSMSAAMGRQVLVVHGVIDRRRGALRARRPRGQPVNLPAGMFRTSAHKRAVRRPTGGSVVRRHARLTSRPLGPRHATRRRVAHRIARPECRATSRSPGPINWRRRRASFGRRTSASADSRADTRAAAGTGPCLSRKYRRVGPSACRGGGERPPSLESYWRIGP